MKVKATEWSVIKYKEYIAEGHSKKIALKMIKEYAQKLGLELIEIVE